MLGMNRLDGKPLDGDGHLAQSIGDLLTTPIGSRVMLRDYGSMLFELIDRPLNAATRLQLIAAVAMALSRWEPRIRLTRARLSAASAAGTVTLDIEGHRTDGGNANSLLALSIPLTN